jgi:hypothetical protein
MSLKLKHKFLVAMFMKRYSPTVLIFIAVFFIVLATGCSFNKEIVNYEEELTRVEEPFTLKVVKDRWQGSDFTVKARLFSRVTYPTDRVRAKMSILKGAKVSSAREWTLKTLFPDLELLESGRTYDFELAEVSDGFTSYQLELDWGLDDITAPKDKQQTAELAKSASQQQDETQNQVEKPVINTNSVESASALPNSSSAIPEGVDLAALAERTEENKSPSPQVTLNNVYSNAEDLTTKIESTSVVSTSLQVALKNKTLIPINCSAQKDCGRRMDILIEVTNQGDTSAKGKTCEALELSIGIVSGNMPVVAPSAPQGQGDKKIKLSNLNLKPGASQLIRFTYSTVLPDQGEYAPKVSSLRCLGS